MTRRDETTTRQRDILRHALGLTRGDKPYRRHFVTGPGSKDWDDCIALTEAGLMVDMGDRGGLYGGDHIFLVTECGANAVGANL